MWTEGETGDGKYLSALADVYPDQRGADRGYQHHVYPGHRHRHLAGIPRGSGCGNDEEGERKRCDSDESHLFLVCMPSANPARTPGGFVFLKS